MNPVTSPIRRFLGGLSRLITLAVLLAASVVPHKTSKKQPMPILGTQRRKSSS
jgi:hypothetical protein